MALLLTLPPDLLQGIFCAVSKLLRKAVKADESDPAPAWGRYTYAIDSALPGKHTLRLYGMLSREDASILAQARTGHTHLNEYRARIKQADSALCECNGGVESVKHVILHCPTWDTQDNDCERWRETGGEMFRFCWEGKVASRTREREF